MTEPDDELVHALRQVVEPATARDIDAALAHVRARSLVVDRRRATARGAALVAAVGVVGTLWLASRPDEQTKVDTISSPTSPTLPTTTAATTQTTVATTVPTTPPTVATTAPAVIATPAPSLPTQTTSRSRASTSTPGAATFHGLGGSVSVRVQGGSLLLVSVQPSSGFRVVKQQVDSDEIDVRFESGAGVTRITLRLSQGRISPVVDESGDGGDGGGGGTGDDHGGVPVDSGDRGHDGGGGGHDSGGDRGHG